MITIPTHILERKDVKSIGKLIMAVLIDTPNTSASIVARRLRMNRKTVLSTMKQMRERGSIAVTRNGNKWTYEVL